jgi:hypothetical protein
MQMHLMQDWEPNAAMETKRISSGALPLLNRMCSGAPAPATKATKTDNGQSATPRHRGCKPV